MNHVSDTKCRYLWEIYHFKAIYVKEMRKLLHKILVKQKL